MTKFDTLEALRRVALELGPELRDRVVFLGGAVTGLLVTETIGEQLRPTDDLDVIAEVDGRAGFYAMQEQLRQRGFHEDTQAPVLCRFRREDLVLDLMPTDGTILGFSNRWYPYAMESARTVELAAPSPDSTSVAIRVVTAACFIATKLDAYFDRGDGDLYHSDVEDIVTVIDGRPDLLVELSKERDDLRQYVRLKMTTLLDAGLEDKISGLVLPDRSSQSRVPLVIATCRLIARGGISATEDPVQLPSNFAFVWILQIREGRPASFYVDCFMDARQHALQPFFKGNRAPIPIASLSDPLKRSIDLLWATASSSVAALIGVDQAQRYHRATDHLSRPIQSIGDTVGVPWLVWRRDVDGPDGPVVGAGAKLEMGAAEVTEAVALLDAEAKRVAAERIREALAAKQAWDES